MNLTIDPWIPALRADGRRDLFSLQDLFEHAHEVRDLAVKPHERIALMRLLLCITQAALDGPAEDAWEQCQPLIQPRVRAYLEKWRSAFELLGDGERFLQVKPGVVASPTPVMEGEGITRLNLSMASGESNATLFDNAASDQREFTSPESALNLLTYQCYSPLLGRGYKGRSPCADNSMLHTYIIGPSLLDTLRLNLLTLSTIAENYSQGFGRPIWEAAPSKKPSEEVQRMLTHSYLGRLVPLARSVWLDSPTRMSLANGLVYDGFLDSGYREATATVVAAKTKLWILKARTDRAIWRELPAVCVKIRQADGVSGPLAFRNPLPDSDVVIWSGALISDQAKIKDAIEAVYSLPAGMFNDLGRAAYERGVKHADEADQALWKAVSAYAERLKIDKPAYDRARQHFWTHVEQHLSSLLELSRNRDLVTDLPNCAWGNAVRDAAAYAFEQSCPRQTPRQIEAYVLGLRKLNFRPKANPQTTNTAYE
jgi:CRISPR system Cascade subunit CasA